MAVPFAVVDAFTDHPFAGNPAAVCVLAGEHDPDWMQAVAAETRVSETAYVRPLGGDRFELRWFTPTVEVDLCGHATLASAHVLWQRGADPGRPLHFETRSGTLTARREADWIALDFPATPAQEERPPSGLLDALGIEAQWLGRTRFDWLAEVASAEAVRAVRPNLDWVAALAPRGVIVTARSDDPAVDFVSRFFAPSVGVDEDPVTGSAHCALGPFWGERLGRNEVQGIQLSARGGLVRVRCRGDRVDLIGQAVTIVEGSLAV